MNPNKNKPAPATNTGRQRGNTGRNDRVNSEQVWNAIRAGNAQANVRSAKQGRASGDLSIKGASGPFVVVGRNFAPGTTAADIQSALEPTTGPMLSCRIVASHPSVVAEFAFAEKQTAELVIANFHNQRVTLLSPLDSKPMLTFLTGRWQNPHYEPQTRQCWIQRSRSLHCASSTG